MFLVDFGTKRIVPDDEIKEIIYNALPSSWQVAMTTQVLIILMKTLRTLLGSAKGMRSWRINLSLRKKSSKRKASEPFVESL